MADENVRGSQCGQNVAALQRRISELEHTNGQLRRTVAALEGERRGLLSFLQDMPVMIDAVDADGNVIFWNLECERVTGYTAEEMVGDSRTVESLRADRSAGGTAFPEFEERRGDFLGRELELTCKDGSTRTVLRFDISQTSPIHGWAAWAIGVDVSYRAGAIQALKESEHCFRSIFENAVDGMVTVDAQTHRVRAANPAFCAMVGYSQEQVTQLQVEDLHADGDVKSVLESFQKRVTGGRGLVRDIGIRRKDGSVFCADVDSIPVTIAGRQHLLGVFRDVSERRRAEELLEQSRVYSDALIKAIPDAISVMDLEGCIQHVNAEFVARTGLPKDRIIGKTTAELGITDAEQSRVIHDTVIARLLEEGSVGKIEATGFREDGSPFPVLWSFSLLTGPSGEPLGVVSSGRDITRVKEAERIALEKERLLGATFDAITEAVLVIDRSGVIIAANETAAQRVGCSIQDLVGRNSRQLGPEIMPEDVRDARGSRLDDVFHTGKPIRCVDQREGMSFDLTFYPAFDGTGQVSRVVVFAADITARVQAEKELLESRQRYHDLVENMSDIIYSATLDGTITSVNQGAKELLGFDRDEILGTHYRHWVPEQELPKLDEARVRALDGERTLTELMLYDKHGQERRVEVSISPIIKGGEVSGTQGVVRDITERRKAERIIRESEERYRSLVEDLGEGVASLDLEGRCAAVNKAFERMLGLAPEAVLGRDLSDFVPKDVRADMEFQYARVHRGESVKGQTRLMHRNGGLIDVEYSLTPALRDGRIVGAQGIIWNITERKQLERMLRESEERYRAVVENAGEAIAVVDEQGIFRFMNCTAARRLGGRPRDFVGRSMWELFPKDVADRQIGHIAEVMRTKKGSNAIGLSMVKEGLRWYNTTIEPLRDGEGNVAAALVIARDIHELKEAQDELEAYRERIIRAEQLASLGTLSATLAHELTQPLTVIRLSIQNSLKELEGMRCPKTVREDLSDGLDELSHAAAIIERFRSFARRSSEKITREVALGDIASRVMSLLEESALRSRVTLEICGLEDLPLICAREKDLEQLFFALSQNAIQAADGTKQARFRIVGKHRAGRVELQFADDCGGISPEHLGRIFEPFFTTKPGTEGTGLGLCIAQRIVAQAGGALRVESRLGKGSTFFVTLPVDGY